MRKKIIVVDDDLHHSTMLIRLISDKLSGVEILIAREFNDMLTLLHSTTADLIIMDSSIATPAGNKPDRIAEVGGRKYDLGSKALAWFSQYGITIPVIGMASTDDQVQALALNGAKTVIAKGTSEFTPKIIEAIRQALKL